MTSEKKVALVTGSATGVGAATCQLLAERGWNVVINYSKSYHEALATASACEKLGSEVLICQADVSDDQACRDMVEKTVEKLGRIDALVNNAGTTRFCSYQDLEGLSEEDFLFLYRINVVGAYLVTRAAVPYLKQAKDPSITNTSSISAISGVGSSIAYAASKGALSTMTLSLAHALAPDIRVNAVCPGFIQGRWTKDFLGDRYDQVKEQIEETTLLGKTSVPEDIGKTIVHLVEDAPMTSGQILVLDGGQLVNQGRL
jgi:3-oxoacyl-[acyl-carrier protein] reductase